MHTRMNRTLSLGLLVGMFAIVLGGALLAQITNPEVGTWKINVEKSKYSPGPAPKSGITKIEAVGDGRKVTVDQAAADGTTRHWEYTANLDGRDNPMAGNNPDADTSALTRSNATT